VDVDKKGGPKAIESGSSESGSLESGSALSLSNGGTMTLAGYETTMTFTVPDMHCKYTCAPTVERTLAQMDGVSEVKADPDARTVSFTAGEGFDLSAAKAALAEVNFPVSEVKS
jgi:copper chaperone CopZ